MMDVTVLVVALSSIVVLVVCTVLVFHPEYEDGLFGRVALAIMAIASLTRCMELMEEGFTRRPFGPVAVVLWFGLAIFLARHLYRFLRWRRDCNGDGHGEPKHGWKRAHK